VIEDTDHGVAILRAEIRVHDFLGKEFGEWRIILRQSALIEHELHGGVVVNTTS
jgi:hypothetical protein